MAIRTNGRRVLDISPALVAEFAVVTAAFVGLYLWKELQADALSLVLGPQPWFGGLLLDGLVAGGLFLGGLFVLSAGFVRFRGIDVGLSLPARDATPAIVLAGVVPVGLVGLTKLVGALTGTAYGSLTRAAYPADPQLVPVAIVTGLGLFVGVPTLVIVSQVLVQGSFDRIVDGDQAVVLTALVTWFVLLSDTGGFGVVPDRGTLVGAVLFAITLGLAVYAGEHVRGERMRYLAYLPLAVVVTVIGLTGVAAIQSVAGGLFVLTHLVVLGLAAATYDRTESLVVPAIAYTSLALANTAVVLLFEAGVQQW